MCRAWEPTPTPASLDRRAPTRPVLWGTRAGSAVRDREGYFAHSGSPRPGPVRPHQYGDTDAAGLRRACSADVEVLLGVVAVMADVEDLVVGQPTDGSLGVGLLGDMHPQGGAACRA